MYRNYLASRADRRLVAAEMPIGDPFGGPAYGERLDVGGIVGGLVGGNSADDAYKAQQQGVQAANQLSKEQFDQIRADNAPFLNNGVLGNNRLAYLLGLNPQGLTGGTDLGSAILVNQGPAGPTYNAKLYSSDPLYRAAWDQVVREHQARFGKAYQDDSDPNAIEARIRQILQPQLDRQKADATKKAQSDPLYGSLLKSFSADDLANDPIYNSTINFALDQGTQGINRQAAATGNMLSGATLKALSRFGANTAAQYGNDAYNRYNTNQTNTYNRLAGISGGGQTAASTISQAGQNYANSASNNLVGLGNARGASSIAQGNAFGDALGGIIGFGAKSLFGI